MGENNYSIDEITLLTQAKPWEGYSSPQRIEQLKKDAEEAISQYKTPKRNYMNILKNPIKTIKKYFVSNNDNTQNPGNKTINTHNTRNDTIDDKILNTKMAARTSAGILVKANTYAMQKAENYLSKHPQVATKLNDAYAKLEQKAKKNKKLEKESLMATIAGTYQAV